MSMIDESLVKASLFTGVTDVSFNEIFKATSKSDTLIEASLYSSGLEKCEFTQTSEQLSMENLETNSERALMLSQEMSGWSLGKSHLALFAITSY